MVQAECGQPQSEFCHTLQPEQKILCPVGSLILLQPTDIQHFINSSSSILSPPGDHNFVSNSISVQHIQNQQQPHETQFFHDFKATQQVIDYGPVYRSIPPESNIATDVNMPQVAGLGPAMTILDNSFRSPSRVVYNIPHAGPGPEHSALTQVQNVPGQTQTITVMGEGQVRLLSVPAPVSLSAHSTVNYLVRPCDFKHCQTIVQHGWNQESLQKTQSQKKGPFPEETLSILKSWLFRNIVHPYPTEKEKQELVSLTGMSLSQLNNWLINSRRRMLKRLLSTLEGDHANFNSRSTRGSARVSSRYRNMWKNEEVAKQVNSENAFRDQSEKGNDKARVSIINRKMSQTSDD